MANKWMAALLAAVAVLPSAATAQDRGRGDGRRVEARAARDGGGFAQQRQRAEQPRRQNADAGAQRRAGTEAARPGRQADRVVREERRVNRQEVRAERRTDVRAFRTERRPDRQAPRLREVPRPQFRAYRQDAPRDRRQDGRADRAIVRDDDRFARPQIRPDRLGGLGQQFRGGRHAGQDGGRGQWNRDWRRDGRYDWNRYRTSNRSLFRLSRYDAPSGWTYGYRRFGVGFTLSSLLFGQDYWIDDPWSYRLPEADGPYRWVRYYNDALLVDLYSGEVVDVVHDIFW